MEMNHLLSESSFNNLPEWKIYSHQRHSKVGLFPHLILIISKALFQYKWVSEQSFNYKIEKWLNTPEQRNEDQNESKSSFRSRK